ncbi:MAG TPA: hypothetical protein VEB22_02445 [Phycisphaerales bacterium]|nr:hypothetical protein [Phycisphaerales bacterium]
MPSSWKRAVEWSAPIWVGLAVWLGRLDADVEIEWLRLRAASALVTLSLTAVFWIVVVIALRPLTASGSAPRARFFLISALVLSWCLGYQALVRIGTTAPDYSYVLNNRLLAFVPALILIFGVREWLGRGPSRRSQRGACLSCGYNLAGLRPDAPCPECGTARTLSDLNNPA